jgi:hypothetical protein
MHPVQSSHVHSPEGNKMKKLFAPPSPETIALRELEESKRELLAAHTAQEYAAKMVEYHQGKIRRLTKFLKDAQS